MLDKGPQGQAQYGMSHAAALERFAKLGELVADDLNKKVGVNALLVMRQSGFFPESASNDELEDSDEFKEICGDLIAEFSTGLNENLIM